MNDSGFFVGLALVLVFWMLGPTIRQVSADRWQSATKICEVNGGVKAVEIVSFYGDYEVFCNNGATFTMNALGD